MKKSKIISRFFFSKAEYCVGDIVGNNLLMKIDYENGAYDLVTLKKKNNRMRVLKIEAGRIATDLLKRKSKVNFATNN